MHFLHFLSLPFPYLFCHHTYLHRIKQAFDAYNAIKNIAFDEIYDEYRNDPGEVEARDSAERTIAKFLLGNLEEGTKEYNDAKRRLGHLPKSGNKKTSEFPYSTGVTGSIDNIADLREAVNRLNSKPYYATIAPYLDARLNNVYRTALNNSKLLSNRIEPYSRK